MTYLASSITSKLVTIPNAMPAAMINLRCCSAHQGAPLRTLSEAVGTSAGQPVPRVGLTDAVRGESDERVIRIVGGHHSTAFVRGHAQHGVDFDGDEVPATGAGAGGKTELLGG